MARKMSSSNIAYKLRRGQKDLLIDKYDSSPEAKKEHLIESVYQASYKTPPPERKFSQGKRAELMEQYLYAKISSDIAREAYGPREPPDYISTTHEHFHVPGFDPDASMTPMFKYPLYDTIPMTFWSENKKVIPGVTATPNSYPNFPVSTSFSKPLGERLNEQQAI